MSSTRGTPKSIFERTGEFGSGQGEEKEEAIIRKNSKSENKKDQKIKTKTIHVFRTGNDAGNADGEQVENKEKDTATISESNLVVCFKSLFPNQFANVDSHVFDQMETC